MDILLKNPVGTGLAEGTGVSISSRRTAGKLLLLCTAGGLSPWDKERISRIMSVPVDWELFLHLAELHGVVPLINHNLTLNGLIDRLPQRLRERINEVSKSILYRNIILSSALRKVLDAFEERGIPAIALKGTILAEQLYGNPGLRPSADMDIMIPPEKVSLAGAILLELGYKQPPRQKEWDHPFHEAPYCKQGRFMLLVELHRNLEDEKLVTISAPEVWQRAMVLEMQGRAVMALSLEHNLLFLAWHLCKHDINLLRSLNDIAELIKKYNGVLDWDYVLKASHAWEIDTVLYFTLRRAREMLGAPVPAPVMKVLKPRAWRPALIRFLVSEEFFIFSTGWNKLRDETYTTARSLMMSNVHKALFVQMRNRRSKKAAWIRTAGWIVLVFSAALLRNTVVLVSRK